MLITRIPPAPEDLVARALSGTRFLVEIEGATPPQIRTYAEIAASLAGEQWEAAHHGLIAETLSPDLIADVAVALVAHADTLRVQQEAALYADHAKTERAIAILATLKASTAGKLSVAKAETQMDHAESDLRRLGVALRRAAAELEYEIDRREWAKADALREGGAV